MISSKSESFKLMHLMFNGLVLIWKKSANLFSGFFNAFILWVVSINRNTQAFHAKISNLRKSNFDLVNYYLGNGDLADAIWRLKIMKKIFPDAKEKVDFLLGWCYYAHGNLDAARQFLGGDVRDLLAAPIEQIKEIKYEIWESLMFYRRGVYYDDFIGKRYNVLDEFVHNLDSEFLKPSHSYKIVILDCNNMYMSKLIDKVVSNKSDITGVSTVPVINNLFEDYCKRLFALSLPDFISINTEKYDIAIAFWSLSFTADIAKYIKQISYFAQHVAILVEVDSKSSEHRINQSRSHYIYNYVRLIHEDLNSFDIIYNNYIGPDQRYLMLIIKNR